MSVIEAAVGWLAPPQCIVCGFEGYALCEVCAASEIVPFGGRCWRCGKLSERGKTCKRCRRYSLARHVWVATDYENTAKNLVQVYKFGHLRIAAQTLAELMTETFRSYNSDEQIQKANYLAVPIPTATSRIRQRGFGHSELLAKTVAKNLELEDKQVLARLGQQRQVGTRRTERLAQTQGNYYVRNPGVVANRNVLLIDDVITTGATLQSATNALKKVGAGHVDALIFAKRL